MGRVGSCFLTSFRVLQFILSLAALGCGVFITYTMFTMADSAKYLSDAIIHLNQTQTSSDSSSAEAADPDGEIEEAIGELLSKLVPLLNNFQEIPTRAILIMVAAAWSLFVIGYIFFAHRSQNHQGSNKRWVRVLMEIVTILLWIVGIVCAILLTLQYGILAMAGGATVKVAFMTTKDLIKNVLEDVVEGAASDISKTIDNTIGLFSDLTTIGLMAIVCAISSIICSMVCFISLIMACCTKNKQNKKEYAYNHVRDNSATPMIQHPYGYASKSGVNSYVSEASYQWPSPQTPGTHTFQRQHSYQAYQGHQMA